MDTFLISGACATPMDPQQRNEIILSASCTRIEHISQNAQMPYSLGGLPLTPPPSNKTVTMRTTPLTLTKCTHTPSKESPTVYSNWTSCLISSRTRVTASASEKQKKLSSSFRNCMMYPSGYYPLIVTGPWNELFTLGYSTPISLTTSATGPWSPHDQPFTKVTPLTQRVDLAYRLPHSVNPSTSMPTGSTSYFIGNPGVPVLYLEF